LIPSTNVECGGTHRPCPPATQVPDQSPIQAAPSTPSPQQSVTPPPSRVTTPDSATRYNNLVQEAQRQLNQLQLNLELEDEKRRQQADQEQRRYQEGERQRLEQERRNNANAASSFQNFANQTRDPNKPATGPVEDNPFAKPQGVKDPSQNYAGEECSFFTKPAVRPDGGGLNYYADGAHVCYGERMYFCVDRRWKSEGWCPSYLGWEKLKAETIEKGRSTKIYADD
jgi:hypothetical protein